MLRSEIYLLAAQVVEGSRVAHSCCAVDDVVAERGSDAREDYRKLFHPDGWEYGPWGNAWLPNKRQCRILALLFMAAISEWEETHEKTSKSKRV